MDKIADLLEKLAVKLGTTVEYLWPKLVERTRYEWLGEFTAGMILVIVGACFARAAVKEWRHAPVTCNNEKDPGGIGSLYTMLGFLLTITGSFITLLKIADINQLITPEAATFMSLISKLR